MCVACIIQDGLIFQAEMELKYGDGGVPDKNWGDPGELWQSPREPPPHYPHHKVTVVIIIMKPIDPKSR